MGLSLDLTPHEMRQRISSSGKPSSALTASLKIATELGSGWKREKLFLHICLNLQVSDVRQSLCAAVPDCPMPTTGRNAFPEDNVTPLPSPQHGEMLSRAQLGGIRAIPMQPGSEGRRCGAGAYAALAHVHANLSP